MDNHISEGSEQAGFDSINKITQIVKEKDQKLIENEALIIYTKIEITKSKDATKLLRISYAKLESENALLEKELNEMDISIDMRRKSLNIVPNLVGTLNQETDRLEADAKEVTNRSKSLYQEYLVKYRNTRSIYEKLPLFKQFEQIKLQTLALEVQDKILMQKTIERRKSNKQHCAIQNQIFNATIVNFAKNVLNYWKSRDLAIQKTETEKMETALIYQLNEVKVLADEKQKTQQYGREVTRLNESLTFKIPEINFPPSSTDATTYSSAPSRVAGDILRPEEYVHQMKARCNQRQQLWGQRRSFTSTVPNMQSPRNNSYVKNMCPMSPKRPFLPSNLPNQNSCSKVQKTAVVPNSDENMDVTNKRSKINIISVVTVQENKILQGTAITQQSLQTRNFVSQRQSQTNINTNATDVMSVTPTNQAFQKQILSAPSQGNKENISPDNQVYPQDVAQDSPKVLQIYQSENIPRPLAAQQTHNKGLTSLMSINKITTEMPQDYYSESVMSQHLSQATNRTTPSQNINKGTSQATSLYLQQAPINNYSQDQMISQSQLVSEKASQENSQTYAPDSYVTVPPSQASVNQNLDSSFINTNEPAHAQVSDKAADNTIRTSQSSTFSQKCREYQQILGKNQLDISMSQMNPNKVVETSPFFNKQNTVEVKQINQSDGAKVPIVASNEMYVNPTEREYFEGNAELSFDEMSFDYDENRLQLSPDRSDGGIDQNKLLGIEIQPQSSGFHLNFGAAQTPQPGEQKTFFGASSNLFNMFP